MPDEAWRLTEEELSAARQIKLTDEAIEDIELQRKEVYDRAVENRFAGKTIDEAAAAFEQRWGFKHRCHCVDDEFTGRKASVSLCSLELLRDCMLHLETKNMEADELAWKVDRLRTQVLELGGTPRD